MLMRCFALSFLLAALGLAVSSAHASLDSQIAEVLHDKLLNKGVAGVKISRLGATADKVEELYQHNANTPLIPASNMKVVTTSAAIETLGADFSFRTQLILHDGDLIVIGDGDPTLGDYELLKKVGWDVNTVFSNWAAVLQKQGIKSIGNVIIDDSVFDEVGLNPNWPADQTQNHYMAEVAGLTLNCNCIDFYVKPTLIGQLVQFSTNPATAYITVKNTCLSGRENAVSAVRQQLDGNQFVLGGIADASNVEPISATIHDPSMYAGTVLAETLKAAGIHITGAVTRDRTRRAAWNQAVRDSAKDWTPIATHETPLPRAMARGNKDSVNLYAECICKRLGFAVSGEGSWKSGTAAVGTFLKKLGVPGDQFKLDDGSGLSKENAVSPNAMSAILIHEFYSKNNKDFMASLPVGGEDGTLKNRFHGTDLRGRVMAKTGFVEGVSCLSGYVCARDNNWYCFVIMFNGIPHLSNSVAKTLEDRIVKAIDASVPEK